MTNHTCQVSTTSVKTNWTGARTTHRHTRVYAAHNAVQRSLILLVTPSLWNFQRQSRIVRNKGTILTSCLGQREPILACQPLISILDLTNISPNIPTLTRECMGTRRKMHQSLASPGIHLPYPPRSLFCPGSSIWTPHLLSTTSLGCQTKSSSPKTFAHCCPVPHVQINVPSCMDQLFALHVTMNDSEKITTSMHNNFHA